MASGPHTLPRTLGCKAKCGLSHGLEVSERSDLQRQGPVEAVVRKVPGRQEGEEGEDNAGDVTSLPRLKLQQHSRCKGGGGPTLCSLGAQCHRQHLLLPLRAPTPGRPVVTLC